MAEEMSKTEKRNREQAGAYMREQFKRAVYYTESLESQNWSPSNIRRVVLAPEGFLVMLHVGSKGGPYRRVNNNPTMVDAWSQSDTFRQDFLSVLFRHKDGDKRGAGGGGTNIPQGLEEVVILNGITTPDEFLSEMRRATQSRNSYKRFVGIITANASLDDFIASTADANKDTVLLSDSSWIQSGGGTVVYRAETADTWYTMTNVVNGRHTIDANNGQLERHFEKVRNLLEKEEGQRVDHTLAQNYEKRVELSVHMLRETIKMVNKLGMPRQCVFSLVRGDKKLQSLIDSTPLTVSLVTDYLKNMTLPKVGIEVVQLSAKNHDLYERKLQGECTALDNYIITLWRGVIEVLMQVDEKYNTGFGTDSAFEPLHSEVHRFQQTCLRAEKSLAEQGFSKAEWVASFDALINTLYDYGM